MEKAHEMSTRSRGAAFLSLYFRAAAWTFETSSTFAILAMVNCASRSRGAAISLRAALFLPFRKGGSSFLSCKTPKTKEIPWLLPYCIFEVGLSLERGHKIRERAIFDFAPLIFVDIARVFQKLSGVLHRARPMPMSTLGTTLHSESFCFG